MNVIYITHYSELYGANRSLLALLSVRKKNHHNDVVIVPERGTLFSKLVEIDVHTIISPVPLCYHIPSNRKSPFYKILRYVINQWGRFKKHRDHANLRKECQKLNGNYSLVHTNTSLTDVGSYIAKDLGLAHIWHIREFGDLDYYFHCDYSLAKKARLMRDSAAIILVGEQLRKHHGLDGLSNVHVVRNGVMPLERANLLDWSHSRPDLQLLILGYIAPTKGQHTTIEALAKIIEYFPGAQLKIVGDGDKSYIKQLRDRSMELGISHAVHFVGKVDDPSEYLLSAKYTLMCSANEAMGRVTAEAMIHGSVVIGYDNAGTSEMIEHGKTGMLYSDGAHSIAQLVKQLEETPELLSTIQSAARNAALQNYVDEIYEIKIREIYNNPALKGK